MRNINSINWRHLGAAKSETFAKDVESVESVLDSLLQKLYDLSLDSRPEVA